MTMTRAELTAKLAANVRFVEAKLGTAFVIVGARSNEPQHQIAEEADPDRVDDHRDAEPEQG